MTLPKKNRDSKRYVVSSIKRKLKADFKTSYLTSAVSLQDAIAASQKRLESSDAFDVSRSGTRWTLFVSGLLKALDGPAPKPPKSPQTILCTRSEPAVLATLLTMKERGYPLEIVFNHSSGRDLVNALANGLDTNVEWVVTADEPLFASSLKSKDSFVQVLPVHPSPQAVIVQERCQATALNVLHAPKESTALSYVAALVRSYPRGVGGLTFKRVALFDYSDWAFHAIGLASDDALVIWHPAASLLLQQGLINPISGDPIRFKLLYSYNASVSVFANTQRLGADLSDTPEVKNFLHFFLHTWRALVATPEHAWKCLAVSEILSSLAVAFTRVGDEVPSSSLALQELREESLDNSFSFPSQFSTPIAEDANSEESDQQIEEPEDPNWDVRGELAIHRDFLKIRYRRAESPSMQNSLFDVFEYFFLKPRGSYHHLDVVNDWMNENSRSAVVGDDPKHAIQTRIVKLRKIFREANIDVSIENERGKGYFLKYQ